MALHESPTQRAAHEASAARLGVTRPPVMPGVRSAAARRRRDVLRASGPHEKRRRVKQRVEAQQGGAFVARVAAPLTHPARS